MDFWHPPTAILEPVDVMVDYKFAKWLSSFLVENRIPHQITIPDVRRWVIGSFLRNFIITGITEPLNERDRRLHPGELQCLWIKRFAFQKYENLKTGLKNVFPNLTLGIHIKNGLSICAILRVETNWTNAVSVLVWRVYPNIILHFMLLLPSANTIRTRRWRIGWMQLHWHIPNSLKHSQLAPPTRDDRYEASRWRRPFYSNRCNRAPKEFQGYGRIW